MTVSAELSRVVSHALRHEVDGGRIRALYGHSLPGQISRTPAQPPALLFHGTSPAAAATILTEGLRPMTRQYVHLSGDLEMARSVGTRKASEPTILLIAARDAAASGVVFYAGNDRVWLADAVPARFISADGPPARGGPGGASLS